jgi:MinD superfamily P-loop ATPase
MPKHDRSSPVNEMIALFAVLVTWYLTKVFYTRKLSIDCNNLAKRGLCELTCSKCARTHVIKEEHRRTPFYCTGCK